MSDFEGRSFEFVCAVAWRGVQAVQCLMDSLLVFAQVCIEGTMNQFVHRERGGDRRESLTCGRAEAVPFIVQGTRSLLGFRPATSYESVHVCIDREGSEGELDMWPG